MKHTERESNFELLRILCMLMIILSHYCVHNAFINTAAASTLGVYLLHDNPTIRKVLWSQLLHTTSYAESPFLVFHALLAVIGIFLVCVAIDKVRILLVEKAIFF